LDWAKNVTAKNAWAERSVVWQERVSHHLIFLPIHFCPKLKTECRLNGKLNHGRPLVARSLASSYRRDRNSSRFLRGISSLDCGSLLPLWFWQPAAERRALTR
jgi:hypothetical protein